VPAERSFDAEWDSCRSQVLAYCRRATRRREDAEDVFQQVALRAWRGYDTFQGSASFLTWVLAIARREVARFHARQITRTGGESSLDDVGSELVPAADADTPEHIATREGNWLQPVAAAAVAAGFLDAGEVTVVLQRLAHPELTWLDLGPQLGLQPANCAAIHARAIPKWRSYLFVHEPDVLGGTENISAAFTRARREALTDAESTLFQRLVLDRQHGYHPRGWRTTLRSACLKVGRYLPVV
jgi:RNA polymerase sigma factor (sigma-70 family)